MVLTDFNLFMTKYNIVPLFQATKDRGTRRSLFKQNAQDGKAVMKTTKESEILLNKINTDTENRQSKNAQEPIFFIDPTTKDVESRPSQTSQINANRFII